MSPDDVGIEGEPDETGLTFETNARIKARYYAARSGLPTLADDSGLEVDALGGAPGVYTRRYAGPDATDADNNAKLLRELAGLPAERRGARYVCVLALALPGEAGPRGGLRILTRRGTCRGRIATAPRGDGGFGYDPIFEPASGAAGRPDARASGRPTEKNAISHRSRAARPDGAGAALARVLAGLAAPRCGHRFRAVARPSARCPMHLMCMHAPAKGHAHPAAIGASSPATAICGSERDFRLVDRLINTPLHGRTSVEGIRASTMIIWGSRTARGAKGFIVGACPCGGDTVHLVVEVKTKFTLYFVPTITTSKRAVVICTDCERGVELDGQAARVVLQAAVPRELMIERLEANARATAAASPRPQDPKRELAIPFLILMTTVALADRRIEQRELAAGVRSLSTIASQSAAGVVREAAGVARDQYDELMAWIQAPASGPLAPMLARAGSRARELPHPDQMRYLGQLAWLGHEVASESPRPPWNRVPWRWAASMTHSRRWASGRMMRRPPSHSANDTAADGPHRGGSPTRPERGGFHPG